MTTVIHIASSTNPGLNVSSHAQSDDGVGAARCGVRFNPDNDARVQRIKALSAVLMQEISNLQHAWPDGDGKRCMATAMTKLEGAQMFAVKGLFTVQNAEPAESG